MLCMQVSSNLPNHLSQARRVPPFILEGPLCSAKEYFLMLRIIFLPFILLIFAYVSSGASFTEVYFLSFYELDCQVI